MRLATKLFIAVAAPCVALAIFTAVATVRSFDRGFEAYVSTRQAAALEAVASALGDHYAEFGSWQRLTQDRRMWRRLLQPILRGELEPDGGGAAPAGPLGRARGPGRLAAALYDASGEVIVGRRNLPDAAPRAPIVVAGATVGTIAVAFPASNIDAADNQFAGAQRRLIWTMLVLSLLGAAAIAWLLARNMLAPVRDMAAATRTLASGNYGVSITKTSNDELGQLADDVNTLAAALAAQQASRQSLMADLAHELRTPLAILQGELEALQDGVRPWSPAAAESLRSEVAGLARLVDDIRMLALADVGELPMETRPVDLSGLASKTIDRFATALAARRLHVHREDLQANVDVQGDAAQLERVLTNLLQNTVRYAAEGGEVWLALAREADTVRLTIEDSGPGVPAAALPRLFERYYKSQAATAEGDRSRQHGGSGIGLALCKAIALRHGGSISAFASPRGGLGIAMVLPTRKGAQT